MLYTLNVPIHGKLATIRPRIQADEIDEIMWNIDPVIMDLDPVVSKSSDVLQMSIDDINTRIHIGQCQLVDITSAHCELGIRIGNKLFWNKGYGTECVNMLCELAFTYMHIHTVGLKVRDSNTRAYVCYAKAGFKAIDKTTIDDLDFIIMEKENIHVK